MDANCSVRLASSRLPSGSARPAAAYTQARGGIGVDARGLFFLHKTIVPLAAKGYGGISTLDVFKGGVPKQKCSVILLGGRLGGVCMSRHHSST